MSTATMAEPKGSRASLQKRLKGVDKLRGQYLAAVDDLKEAKRLVDVFERPAGYEEAFQRRADELSRELNWLMNQGRQNLINGCKDDGLRAEFQYASQRRRQAGQAYQTAEQNLASETERQQTLRDRIANGTDGVTRHGEPGVIGTGGGLPWQGPIAATGSLFGSKSPNWAISPDGRTIEFDPRSVHQSTVDFFKREWGKNASELKLAQLTFDEATVARDEAEKALDAARDALVWSEV